MSDDEIKKLFSLSESEYGEDYQTKLFEQYRIFLQMIDNLAHRRSMANSFFLSVNTGLLAAFGLFVNSQIISLEVNSIWIMIVSFTGMMFSYAWYRTAESYTQLSSVKWEIVLEIEKKLPLLLHDTEWRLLSLEINGKKYKKLTDVEKAMPWMFIAIYSISLALIITT